MKAFMSATNEFKNYLNSVQDLIPDAIHDQLWILLINCISENETLKRLLEFADVPKIFIENPNFIFGNSKPSQSDIEWAKEKIKEYESRH